MSTHAGAPHTGTPRDCGACADAYDARAPHYHPASDVGPWDEACPACGHLGGHLAACPVPADEAADLDAARAAVYGAPDVPTMTRLIPPPTRDRRALEGDVLDVPERAFRPPAEQSPAVAVVCTRLAQNLTLGDPGDFGGDAVVELVAPDGTRERFAQFLAFHKSDGFEFGYAGSGPSALAANVLGLVLPPREAWRLHQDFKRAFVAPMSRDGGTIRLDDVRAWVEARWAAERADAALMADEAERRALAAELGAADDVGRNESADDGLDEHREPRAAAPGAAHVVELRCETCGRAATVALPDPVDGPTMATLPALVHTRATCAAWRTAVLRWPDGRALVVEISEPGA